MSLPLFKNIGVMAIKLMASQKVAIDFTPDTSQENF